MPIPLRGRGPSHGKAVRLPGSTLILAVCCGLCIAAYVSLSMRSRNRLEALTDPRSLLGHSGSADKGPHKCHIDPRNEYHGDVVTWGDKNIKDSEAACCESCMATTGCNVWVWCGTLDGCGNGRGYGECWLKRNTVSYVMDNTGKGHAGILWTAGALYSEADEEAWRIEKRKADKTEAERLLGMKNDPELPLVYMDIALKGELIGRIEMVLFVKDSPRAAENMRQLCSGEKGKDASGQPYHLKGSYFYRIIDRFIDQTGAAADGIYDGEFHDDPGGLKLRHDRKGLLSMANGGPNTNGGHFSLIQGPAHHLDGSYVIFGEIVSGFEIAERVNKLSYGAKNNELLQSKDAQIVDAGQLRRGTYVDTPAFREIIDSEMRRVAWRNKQPRAELTRTRALFMDQDLPLVYFDVAIKGKYAGRIEMALFAKESPRYAENFKLLCSGAAGIAPEGHEGAGKPYHFKGIYFYRIIKGFIDQAGQSTDSPLGGLFRDDPEGLKLNHTHPGLLSAANIGPDTNGAHFSIIMGAPRHLDGHYTIFGELVDGQHVTYEINALADGQPNNEHLNSQDAQIIDSGILREGKYTQTAEYKKIIEDERAHIAATRKVPTKRL